MACPRPLNACVPARAGDVARVYLMGEAAGRPKTGAATGLVLEKVFDATTLLLPLGLVSLLVELPAPLAGVRRGFAAAAVLFPLAVVALDWRGTVSRLCLPLISLVSLLNISPKIVRPAFKPDLIAFFFDCPRKHWRLCRLAPGLWCNMYPCN